MNNNNKRTPLSQSVDSQPGEPAQKRKRGRPPKNPVTPHVSSIFQRSVSVNGKEVIDIENEDIARSNPNDTGQQGRGKSIQPTDSDATFNSDSNGKNLQPHQPLLLGGPSHSGRSNQANSASSQGGGPMSDYESEDSSEDEIISNRSNSTPSSRPSSSASLDATRATPSPGLSCRPTAPTPRRTSSQGTNGQLQTYSIQLT
jgi:hypothetical protein